MIRIVSLMLVTLLCSSAQLPAQAESGIYGVVRALTPDGLYSGPVAGDINPSVRCSISFMMPYP